MSNSPLVSICIPSYNHQKYIAETIASIILQDYQNIELIIIDDCSTDNSDAVINTFVEQCKARFVRFEYYKNPENKGISYNLNQAIKWANGKYFYAIASDDILMPFKTSLLVSKIEKLDNSYAAIFGDALFIGEHSEQGVVSEDLQTLLKIEILNSTWSQEKLYKTFLEFHSALHNKNYLVEDFQIKYGDFFGTNFLPAMSSLIKLDSMKNVGGYTNGNRIEDLEMWLKLTQKYKMKLITTPVAYYRFHRKNSYHTMKQKLLIDELKLMQSQKEFALANNLADKFYKRLYWLIEQVNITDHQTAKYYADINNIKLITK